MALRAVSFRRRRCRRSEIIGGNTITSGGAARATGGKNKPARRAAAGAALSAGPGRAGRAARLAAQIARSLPLSTLTLCSEERLGSAALRVRRRCRLGERARAPRYLGVITARHGQWVRAPSRPQTVHGGDLCRWPAQLVFVDSRPPQVQL